jgi:hypothetical protein
MLRCVVWPTIEHDRFVLPHFVTASAQSAQLAPTLHRLIAELSGAFSLEARDEADALTSSAAAAARDNEPDAVADGDELPGTGVFAALTGGASGDDGGGGAQLQIERLSTRFSEVLRAAAQRAGAGVVLLLDGVDQLGDGSMRWLPTPLPPGVRVLVGSRTLPRRIQGACDVLQLGSCRSVFTQYSAHSMLSAPAPAQIC